MKIKFIGNQIDPSSFVVNGRAYRLCNSIPFADIAPEHEADAAALVALYPTLIAIAAADEGMEAAPNPTAPPPLQPSAVAGEDKSQRTVGAPRKK